MKKFVVLTLSILVFQNCAAPNTRILLKPSNESLNNKLKPLIIGTGGVKFISEKNKSITTQTHLATLFEREVETNLCELGKEKFGYIDLKLIYNHTGLAKSAYNIFLLVVNIPTVLIPIGLGMPSQNDVEIEIELTIYDKNNNKIKSYNDSYITTFYSSLWHSIFVGQYESHINYYYLKGAKKIMKGFKQKLNQDVVFINKELEKSGMIIN